MSVITGRRLNRFWQNGIKPLKDLLGSRDIDDLSEDGTVTGALSKLNTDIENTWDTLGNYQIIWRRFFQMSKSGVLSLQNTTITGSFSVESPVAADQLWVIPVGVSYGNLSASPSATQSGGPGTYTINVSAAAQNLTTETHTVTVNVLVIAVKTKS